MNRLLSVILVFCLSIAATAQPPAGWKTFKDTTGTCQVSVPADWTINNELATARDAKNAMTVSITYEQDAKMEVLDATYLKMTRTKAVIENTAQRNFTEGRGSTFGRTPSRTFTVMVGAKPKGSCRAGMGLKDGGSEELIKKVGMTLVSAK